MNKHYIWEMKMRSKELLTYSYYYFHYLKNWKYPSQIPTNKFVLFALARTGSTLLMDLLSSHPHVSSEGEIFLHFRDSNFKFRKVLLPETYLKSRAFYQAIKSKDKVYGCDIKLPQLIDITLPSKDAPQEILLNLTKSGWKILNLQRKNILRQAISIQTAFMRKQWHNSPKNSLIKTKVNIDYQMLLKQIHYFEDMALQENKILQKIPHFKLVYEDDLLKEEQHQITLDRIFKYLDLPSAKVKTQFKRVSSDNLSEQIENYEDLISKINQTKYAKFIDF